MYRISLISTVALLLFYSPASADLVYQFGQSNYEVAAGGTVDVDIFLVQNNPTADPIDLTVDGLFSAGVRVFFNDNPPTDPAEVLSDAAVRPNVLFDDTFGGATIDLVAGESAGFADAVDDFNAPLLGDRILLGTIGFTAGSLVGEVTNLRAERFDGLLDNTFANDLNATSLDAITGAGFSTITVTAVPEPSSLVLVASVGVVFLLRRRKNAETADALAT